MKSVLATGLVATALLAQQAAATSWGSAKAFSNPSNTNNNCTADQNSGFDWSSLPAGGFSQFGGIQFSGFSCQNTFAPNGKRSLVTRSDFQSKCIQGTVSKKQQGAPAFSCGQNEKFSITEMQVSVSYDTDLDFIFSMPDGSTCTHTASCSAGGSTIQNQQCGGAKSVSFQMPQSGSDKGCDIGIHSVGFDCQPASTPPATVSTVSSTSSVKSTTSSVATTTSTPETQKPPTTTSAIQTPPTTTSTTEAPPTTKPTTEAPPTTTQETQKPPTTTSEVVTTSTTTPASSDIVTTEIIISTVTTCPVTLTTTSGSSTITQVTSTVSTTTLTSTTTYCPKCGEAPPTGPPAGPPAGPPTSAPKPPPNTTTKESPPPSSAPEVTTTSAPSLPPAVSTSEIITTEIVISTLTTCPVTITSTSGSSTITSVTTTVSTLVITSTSTICTKCTGRPPSTLTSTTLAPPPKGSSPPDHQSPPAPPPPKGSSSPPSPPPSQQSSPPPKDSSSPPSPPPSQQSSPPSPPPPAQSSPAPPPKHESPCPQVLPSCLNTWLSLVPDCKSNSDKSCFCPSSKYTNAVISCVQSWSNSNSEMQAAMSYFAGICADFIPQNPAICTAVPSTITLVPTPATSTVTVSTAGTTLVSITMTTSKPEGGKAPKGGDSGSYEWPATTISFTKTVAIPSPPADHPESTYSVVTTAVTVPQVSFYTATQAAGAAPSAGTDSGSSPDQGGFSAAPDSPSESVGLVPFSSPAAAAAAVTTDSGSGSGYGSSYYPTASATTVAPASFTGGASTEKALGANVVVAGVLGLVALLA